MNWNKVEPGTLLLVCWDDIVSDATWLKDAAAQTLDTPHCKDIGWFVNDDKLNIRITSSVNDYCEKNVTVIPKGCIRKVKKINYKRK